MGAIELCRTAALGVHLEQCDQCRHQRIAYDSCRNRYCPKCQSLARAQWIEDRQSELLTGYFHAVFTLPEEIAAIAYQNKKVVYDILFRATSETLRTIAADPKHLGAEIGFFAVLHTWGQNLMFHPHLHCVVPSGGLSPDGKGWVSCRPGLFLSVHVLSRLFRRLFLELLQQAFDAGQLHFFTSLLLMRMLGSQPLHSPDLLKTSLRTGVFTHPSRPLSLLPSRSARHRSSLSGYQHSAKTPLPNNAIALQQAFLRFNTHSADTIEV
jgi:hypothetical protein